MPANAIANRSASVAGVTMRVIARTFEYDNSPRAIAAASNGNSASAWATRTFSRAGAQVEPDLP